MTLPQLRQRMPSLQKQTQAVESELQSLKMAAVDEAKYLQLAESLAGFRSKLRVRAEAMDIVVRQQILRLLVKEVLVGGDTITLRHSIPIPQSGPGSNGSPVPSAGVTGSRSNLGYPLRSGSHYCPLRCPYRRLRPLAVFAYSRFQPFLDQAMDSLVGDSVLDETHRPFVTHAVEEAPNVRIHDPVHSLPYDPHAQRIQCPPKPAGTPGGSAPAGIRN